ncbi:RNA polymerase sigma factor [Sphingomonas sp. CLY1604]|uniref:RNA polymerase sigma factor n=1 Tax=Sphingomonas sp. CLY1604 TaxID=3457786 RepID=UPI003FD803FA
MIGDDQLKSWFCEAVLPLEAELTRFIRRNWRAADDVQDLRQEIYELALTAARQALPMQTRAHLFTIARNVIINKAKRGRVVSFEQIADLETLDTGVDYRATEQHLDARDALRRTQIGLDALPPRCREVVRLRKIEGLSTRETAERLGVGLHTVERQLVLGIRAMTDFLLGGDGRIRRETAARRRRAPS